MKVYAEELPKNCIECPFCKDIKINAGMDRLLFCKANKGKVIKNVEKSFNKCIVKNEFQSFTDYTKQVRKEVGESITKFFKENFVAEITGGGKYLVRVELDKLNKFLDQIQGEKNVKD